MTILLSRAALEARRSVAATSLNPLARSLATDFAAVIERPLYVPAEKALLSREGGRCTGDGTLLDFDPFSPRSHRCATCGAVYTGELHDRFWIYWYQLWLAERAVHGALLGVLGIEPRGIGFAMSVLDAYVDRYPTYPNSDNVLGPTRPFFSTYLESIWLLQLCVALDLLENSSSATSVGGLGGRFRDRVVAPSLTLIRSFDEGMSNRQVWNNAAMMAANRLLGNDAAAEELIWSESGLAMHLTESLLPDGTWYEGENYHLFAHRGLWYAMTIAEQIGAEVPAALIERFDAGFATPFLTALPDFTLPSRRDSQYAISLRQWRFAEMCELGLARRDNGLLTSALTRLYGDAVPRGATGRRNSSAEAERNTAATSLSRADLGWRSLLFARADFPGAAATPLPSVLLEAQGIAVLRREAGRTYVALDYGHSGGGHGHPDRLNVLLSRDATRWLDDYGTGSYVDPSLHWYRSTLAHNAPLIDGRSQQRVSGVLRGFEDRGGAGWISASAEIAPGAVVTRTVVAMPSYLVDEMRWRMQPGSFIDLPIHIDASPVDRPGQLWTSTLRGGDGTEDGFRFVREPARIAKMPPHDVAHLRGKRDGADLDVWLACDAAFEIWRATGPAAPGQGEASFLLVRCTEPSATLRTVISWANPPADVALFPAIAVTTEGERHEHTEAAHGWDIVIRVGDARSTIDLGGRLQPSRAEPDPADDPEDEPRRAVVLRPDRPVKITLGSESYRRSELSWEAAGQPSAHVTLENDHRELIIEVSVVNVARSFVPADAINRFDNEPPDINGDGIQLYLRTDDAQAGYVLAPRTGSDTVGVRPIDGWGAEIPIRATWTDIHGGYVVEVRIGPFPEPETVVEVDVIINEMPLDRARRRGQLALSGGAGEFVYLRGDRHDPSRLIPLLLTDG